MSNFKDNTFYETDFKNFASAFEGAIKEAVENYWETDFRVKLEAINNFRDLREEKIISKVPFFSSLVKVQNHRPVVFRLSDDFINSILSKILSKSLTKFSLQNLTELEVRILNNFCEFLYKQIDPVLIPAGEIKISPMSEKNINLIFLISNETDECSKIMLSIPQDRLRFEHLEKKASFKDEHFLTSKTNVRIKAGSSKITLDELKHLAKDDIILLEESKSSKLTLISGEFQKEFKVKVDPSLVLNIDTGDSEEEKKISTDNEVTMDKNLWDDIQIEINAEFEKVKMTIGELKQITQGQIVDLGSVFDNEITLFVENKVVAKGELIIINDRYAVKLNEVLSPKKEEIKPPPTAQPKPAPAPAPAKPAATGQAPAPKPAPRPIPRPAPRPAPARPIQSKPAPKPAPAPAPKPKTADEDFDYSDFEK